MNKTPKAIAAEIMALVSELSALAGEKPNNTSTEPSKLVSLNKRAKSGATGGIRLLAEDGKLNPPKQLAEIMELLKQDGRHYGKSTVAMGLASLVRERVLTRFKDQGGNNWKYAIRK